MSLDELLERMNSTKASDLHLIVGIPPIFRINGTLAPEKTWPVPLDADSLNTLLAGVSTAEQRRGVLAGGRPVTLRIQHDDLAVECEGYQDQENLALAIRRGGWPEVSRQ